MTGIWRTSRSSRTSAAPSCLRPTCAAKKDLIDSFVESLSSGTDVQRDWKEYIVRKKQEEFERIVSEEHLKTGLAEQFIIDCFKEGYVDTDGTRIVSMLPLCHASRRATRTS